MATSDDPTHQQEEEEQPARLKTVYFTVGTRQEVAVFEDQTSSDEIKSNAIATRLLKPFH